MSARAARLLVGVAVLSASSLFAAAVSASAVVNPFAGDWNTNTGTLHLQVVDATTGTTALRALGGGSGCGGTTVWYSGSYGGADSGKIAGCTDASGTHLTGDYRSVKGPQHGTVSITTTFTDPNTFTGTYDELSSQGTGTGSYHGTFAGDFSGSGRLAPSSPTPVLAQSVAAATVTGQVLVERPGTHVFVPLSIVALVPVGAVVNATSGRVRLTSAQGHTTYTGEFYGGEFTVTQSRSGLTDLILTGGAPCAASAGRASRSPVRRQHLWGDAHGSFSISGSYAAATVLGTRWLTEDTCTGTLIRVATGEVRVNDFVRHRSLVLRAPHRYFARS
jgi:hypothetical protein